jgi:hypothetical protein
MDPETAKLLGTGGVAGALLVLIYLVGMRLVRALDALGGKVDNHHTADAAHHAEMSTEIAEMRTEIQTVLGITPPLGNRIVRNNQ